MIVIEYAILSHARDIAAYYLTVFTKSNLFFVEGLFSPAVDIPVD